jgi:DNA repair photolyase
MSPASSHALKHPPVTAPSEPAGADSDFPELAVAIDKQRRRGRGAQSNASGRFEAEARVAFDDGWQSLEELPPFKTTVGVDTSRKVITRNESPDIGFDRSINPYRGCEHGCVYCFARPTHAYLGLSPGLDFESKLFAKPEAPKLLERELSAAGYVPRTIAIGTNTDPYQPIEREHQVMRRILEVLDRFGHPVGIVTKSALVVRDLFREWLMANFPDRYRHVFKLIRETRGGKDYDSTFGKRMTGGGPVAWMIGRRFEVACDKLGFNKLRTRLATSHFNPPPRGPEQLSLF